MTNHSPEEIALGLTESEREALRSLPTRDRGDMPEPNWYAYHSLMDSGLMTTKGAFNMVRTALGEKVFEALRHLPSQ